MSPISPNTSISGSYNRISGGTPIISTSQSKGPQLKSKTQSAMEDYSADRAVREAIEKERMQKEPGYAYLKNLQNLQGKTTLDSFNKKIDEENKMKERFSREIGTGQDYQKWRNWQEVQSGSSAGQNLMAQRLAQLGGNVNSAEYKGLSSMLRNAQLAQQPNTLW